MPTSEIDDIFAAKGKAKAIELAPLPSLKEKKEKKKKRKDRPPTSDETKEIDRSVDSKTLKKRPLPETVVDPSFTSSSSSSKRSKLDASASSQREKTSHETRNEAEARFKDSRGSGPRRKTDDGFNIYKEDELGISNAGGDTPLCPFDCECCF